MKLFSTAQLNDSALAHTLGQPKTRIIRFRMLKSTAAPDVPTMENFMNRFSSLTDILSPMGVDSTKSKIVSMILIILYHGLRSGRFSPPGR